MSLQPDNDTTIPERTAQVARAAFPQGHPCLRLRDELGTMSASRPCFPRPAETPWRWSPCCNAPSGSPTARLRDRLAWK